MADDMSVAERASERASERLQRFGTIVVVGGGCYGSYYVRQLTRAHRAGALAWERVVVVDRDARCRVAGLAETDRPPGLELAVSDWRTWFDAFLGDAAARTTPPARDDAIVPS